MEDSASEQNIIFITNQLTVLTQSGPRSKNWLRQLKSQLVLIGIIGLGMLSTLQINPTV